MTTPTSEFKEKSTIGFHIIRFGIDSGTTSGAYAPATRQIQFSSGNVIDSITIDGKKYGGNGGGASPVYQFPPYFQVTEIWAGDGNISNMTINLGNNQIINIGNGSHKEVVFYPTNLLVWFNNITYGDYVNQIIFGVGSPS